MSNLLDALLLLKDEDSKYKAKIRREYECKFKHCKILESVINTRAHGLGSRISDDGKYNELNLSIEELCMMELLEFIHIRLFHKQENYRERLPNRAGTYESKPEDFIKHIENKTDSLFIDTIDYNLNLLQIFCDENEYDSEAYHDDMFPDEDGQSNIYWLFKTVITNKMNQYEGLKEKISLYSINPPDRTAIERNLIDLDFGHHVTEWNVEAKYFNMKQEWMKNEFFPINSDVCKSIEIKSAIIANQTHNKSTYNLSV
eukprot:222660_1